MLSRSVRPQFLFTRPFRTFSADAGQNKTALYDYHVKHGAKMVPFAGYLMPLQYGTGVKTEHLHTRSSVGIFDVSHMG